MIDNFFLGMTRVLKFGVIAKADAFYLVEIFWRSALQRTCAFTCFKIGILVRFAVVIQPSLVAVTIAISSIGDIFWGWTVNLL